MTVVTTQTTNKGGAPLGNRNASHSKPLTHELRKIIAADGYETLHRGLRAVYQLAGQGDIKALEFIFDRLDGRPRQGVDVSGDAVSPVVFVVRPELTREEWMRIHSGETIDAPEVIEGQATALAAGNGADGR